MCASLSPSAFAAPIPPPMLDETVSGTTIDTPLEGAFWLPLTYIEYASDLFIDQIEIEVTGPEGEPISGSLQWVNLSPDRVFWRADTPLTPGVLSVSLSLNDNFNPSGPLAFNLNVIDTENLPTDGSATLNSLSAQEVEVGADEVCCVSVNRPEECDFNPRGVDACNDLCWPQSYIYVPNVSFASMFTLATGYESFYQFEVSRHRGDASEVAQRVWGDVGRLSTVTFETEDMEYCISVRAINVVGNEQLDSEILCLSSTMLETIERREISTTMLNQEAEQCAEMPEGYPLSEESGGMEGGDDIEPMGGTLSGGVSGTEGGVAAGGNMDSPTVDSQDEGCAQGAIRAGRTKRVDLSSILYCLVFAFYGYTRRKRQMANE